LSETIPLFQPAPDFSLSDLRGEIHTLHQFRGHVVVINFWSAECPWSARADSVLRIALNDLKGIMLLTIASNINETPEQIEMEAKKRGLSLVLIDNNSIVAGLYHAATTPHIFIVDQSGILQYQGAFDDVTFRQRIPSRNFTLEALTAIKKGLPPEYSQTEPYGCTIVRHLV
jgi:peroxiredoxin